MKSYLLDDIEMLEQSHFQGSEENIVTSPWVTGESKREISFAFLFIGIKSL